MTWWFYDLSKFVLWLFFRAGFGLEVVGREHVPRSGAFLVASNHVSYLDPPLVGAACPRRLRSSSSRNCSCSRTSLSGGRVP